MPFKFAANISTIFTAEKHLPERYKLAAAAGFKAVELQFPYDYVCEDLVNSKNEADVTQVLINSYPGQQEQFGFGISENKPFMDNLKIAIPYAEALDCERIHILSGLKYPNLDGFGVDQIISNLTIASEVLKNKKMIGLIEPICPEVKDNYFLDSYVTAEEILDVVEESNIKLLLDVFHLQMLHGNVLENIERYFPFVGHIQISQAPNRNEPNAPGPIDYRSVFTLLEELSYNGYIGLEYFPTEGTNLHFEWLNEFGYSLETR